MEAEKGEKEEEEDDDKVKEQKETEEEEDSERVSAVELAVVELTTICIQYRTTR